MSFDIARALDRAVEHKINQECERQPASDAAAEHRHEQLLELLAIYVGRRWFLHHAHVDHIAWPESLIDHRLAQDCRVEMQVCGLGFPFPLQFVHSRLQFSYSRGLGLEVREDRSDTCNSRCQYL